MLAIFPEATRFAGRYPVEKDMIPFVIARLAVDAGELFERFHMRTFALDVLHDLLDDQDQARKVYERYGFGYKEFIEMTGRFFDVLYDIEKPRTRLGKVYERYGFGYKEFIEMTGRFFDVLYDTPVSE